MEDDRSFVLLDHTGFIRHSVDHVLRVFCDYKITMFPFDRQNCTIHYEPWHSTQKEVFIEVHPEPDVNNYRPSNEWDLISYTARVGLGSYPPILSQSTARAFYDIVIKRRRNARVASEPQNSFLFPFGTKSTIEIDDEANAINCQSSE